MYICPICKREFIKDTDVSKHFLACWKQENPFHKSKEAPHSADIVVSNVNDDVLNFFNQYE